MMSAKSEIQVDTPEVRVTEWRLAPGSATGHHVHQMDYVIVPVTSGEMTIVAPNGERSKAQLGLGKSYFRKAGVEHDVLNESPDEIIFLEVELKPYPGHLRGLPPICRSWSLNAPQTVRN